MTLKELIAYLESMPQYRVVRNGFGNPHSYRGYYSELAFEPEQNVTIAYMLECARSAVNQTFTGYKGGEYKMHPSVDVYLANEGCTGEQIGRLLMNYICNDEVE